MIRWVAWLLAAGRLLALAAALVLTPAALAQQPAPEKLEQLVQILSDPAVKAWLEQQSKVPKPAAAAEPGGGDASSLLSRTLASIEAQVGDLIAAYDRLPAQLERAKNILLVEFQDRGLLGLLLLILVFIAAGFGMDWLARWLLKGYRGWFKALPNNAPRARVKVAAARGLYALIMMAAFIIGSAGVFLIFHWPPLLREIVLGYLSVAIITRVALMLGRLVLMPPFLGLPNPDQLRLVPMSDARATHWYIVAGVVTAWFVFWYVTLELLETLGFDRYGRLALGAPAAFGLLLILLAAIWLRPEATTGGGGRVTPRAASWLLTAFFFSLWCLWYGGLYTVFWLVFAAVALPATIGMFKSAVHFVLRPPEEGADGEAFPPVLIAVIDRGIRVCLIVAAAFFLARVWGLEFTSMTQGDDLSQRLLRGALNAAVIVLAADFGWTIAKALIARKLGDGPTGHGVPVSAQQARLRTLLPIFQNILFAVIVVMTVLMILSSLEIEIAPLIAGAGVVGVAIGFGAQTLVKDVISGMFYLLDDAFRVGEYIESGSHKGTVESFSLRSVKLRHHRGYLATVPFGELGAVQNMSRDWVIDKMSVTVGYNTDIDKARKLIKKLGQELAEDPEFKSSIIEPLKMQGVQNFGDYGIEIRLKMMTKPGEQFPIRRRAYIRLKQLFEQNGIEIPVPTVQVRGDAGSAEAAAAAQSHIAAKAVPAA